MPRTGPVLPPTHRFARYKVQYMDFLNDYGFSPASTTLHSEAMDKTKARGTNDPSGVPDEDMSAALKRGSLKRAFVDEGLRARARVVLTHLCEVRSSEGCSPTVHGMFAA